MVSDEQLLEDLKAFADEIGETPTTSEMYKNGPWNDNTYKRHFGSWNNALTKAGLKINRECSKNASDEELIEDLKAFADEIGGTPTCLEISKNGPWNKSTYKRHFGSWNNALTKAGLEINQEGSQHSSDEELIEDLKTFADEIGGTPTHREMRKNGPWSEWIYYNQFGSWNNALEEAGLEIIREYPVECKWDDSVTDYYGESWDEARETVLERDNRTCRVCESEENIHVHHIKPRRLFEDPDNSNSLHNLICLCSSCHSRFENRWVDCEPDEFEQRATQYLQV